MVAAAVVALVVVLDTLVVVLDTLVVVEDLVVVDVLVDVVDDLVVEDLVVVVVAKSPSKLRDPRFTQSVKSHQPHPQCLKVRYQQ